MPTFHGTVQAGQEPSTFLAVLWDYELNMKLRWRTGGSL